jgi:hypothetical protein
MAADGSASLAEGWYGDPWQVEDLRWWDGRQWTGHTSVTAPDDRSATDRDGPDGTASGPVSIQAEPATLPTVLSSPGRMIGPGCALALALVPLWTMFGIFFGNHRGFSWNLVAGESVLSVIFLLLLWIGLRMVRHPPSLELTVDGAVIHHGRKSIAIAWEDITDVGITVRKAEGLTFMYPTLRDRTGKEQKVVGLVETPGHVGRAQEAVAVILATRDHQLAVDSDQEASKRA